MLRDWLSRRGMRHKEFADRLGLSAGYLSDLISGAKKPSLPLALRIDQETGGLVGPGSWYSAAELSERYVPVSPSDGGVVRHGRKSAPAAAIAQGNEVAP